MSDLSPMRIALISTCQEHWYDPGESGLHELPAGLPIAQVRQSHWRPSQRRGHFVLTGPGRSTALPFRRGP